MRNMVFAAAITIGASALLFLLVTAVGLPAEMAKGVASVPALAIKSIYDFLETQSAKRTLARAKSLVSFEEFTMHPLSMFVLSGTMYIAVVNFSTMLYMIIVGGIVLRFWLPVQPLFIFGFATLTAVPFAVVALGHIGRWVGSRSRFLLYGLAVATASTVAGHATSIMLSIGNYIPDTFNRRQNPRRSS